MVQALGIIANKVLREPVNSRIRFVFNIECGEASSNVYLMPLVNGINILP